MQVLSMLNLNRGQPNKQPTMAMYFTSEESPEFAVFIHFFIDKNVDAFSYLSLYKSKYTHTPI